jgi:hypothetical protein
VKLFLILVLDLRQFFIVRIFVKRATELLIILAIIQPNKDLILVQDLFFGETPT